MSDELEPTLADLLQLTARRLGTEQQFGDLPAKVLAYNAAQQTVDVSPLVLVAQNDELRPVPILRGLQVRWPAGATWSIVGELVAGDFGWIRIAGADISGWRTQGAELDPTAIKRRGALSDAAFEPGSQPVSTPLPSDAYKAGALVLKAAALYLGDSTATDFVALASKVLTELQAIKTWADAHLHDAGGYSNGGGPVTGVSGIPSTAPAVPDPMPAPSSVAASKVYAI